MNREEEITKVFKKYDMPTSNPFFFEILKVLKHCEDEITDEYYWKGFNNGIRTEKFRESKNESCNDCVSRQEALKCFTWTNDKADVWYGIKNLPSVTPKAAEYEDVISRARVVEWLHNCTDDSIEHAIDSNLEFIPSVIPRQNDVLDKIREEINKLPFYAAKFADGAFAIHIEKEKVLQIIDKYTTESEDTDANSN